MSVRFYLSFLVLYVILALAEAITYAKPGCQEKCGNITIPYPFGIGSRCFKDRWTELKCDTTSNPPKLFFSHHIPYQFVGFSTDAPRGHYVRVKNNISTTCSDGAVTSSYDSFQALSNSPFSLYDNDFFVIGCYMYGTIAGAWRSNDSVNFRRGCATVCDKIENSDEGECFGPGCCKIRFPVAEQYNIHVETLNGSGITDTRCGFAFLADDEYKFKASDIESLRESTVRLNYIMENQTCEDAKKDKSSFACKDKSVCIDSARTNLLSFGGYYCTCDSGYEGNPYLDMGCQGECLNTPGSYNVCARKSFRIWIFLGVGLGLFLLGGGGAWVFYIKRKQLLKLREKLARLNARLVLIQEISSNARIFTAKKLEQATNNFHQSRILGQGGYGTVYKGILPDQSIVAVKKSKIIEKSQFDEFINEVAILAKIDHRNIVKLLGCSVETEHPLLVYEFVSNGTLSDHIFKKSGVPYMSMSWENRLRIAAEIAGALAYLHSAASIPIIHRDVKSSNILLDDHFTAKVADFGVSRVNHLDQTEISTLVKGTMGYLDPEYMLTSQLTEKSDVFSFGVVLAELLTGKRSISFERAQGERNLAIYFTVSMNEERLLHIVEEGMVNAGNLEQVQAAAALVQRCLNFKGEERPYMKEVASELEALRGFNKKPPSSQRSNKEGTNFTSEQRNLFPTRVYNDGASGSSVAEVTMSIMVAR